MPSESTGYLTIQSAGDIPLFKVRLFLTALERSYSYVYVADMLLSNPGRRDRWQQVRVESEKRFARWVPLKDRIILSTVELHSPGQWSFLGSLIPFETIRKYLQDRHERRKDKTYREAAEKQSMSLDNSLKEQQLLGLQIENAKKLGATEDDLRPLLNRLVREPLHQLDRFQDEGIIGPVNTSVSKSADSDQPYILPSGRRRILLPDPDDGKNTG